MGTKLFAGMFTYIRDFVRSLLDRESSDAKHPIFSRHRLKVRLVSQWIMPSE